MPRHLSLAQIESALHRGKSVEQFLGPLCQNCIARLEIRPTSEEFQLWRYETFDDGNEQFIDVYSFSPVEGDWPEEPASRHDSIADALQAAEQNHTAKPDRWVNQFVVQDEYRDYVATRL